MLRRHFLAAQAWYAISQGAPAFLNPFLNLFFTRLGISPTQIGVLSALRPWISAPCGSLIAGLADRWEAHRGLLLFSYLGMTLVQGLMALPAFGTFAGMLALTIVSSTVYTPASILADAAVMAASTHPGDYGRLRTWASVSWTAFAPLAGWVNSRFGIRVGIVCYVVGSLLAVPAAWMLPVGALRRKVAPLMERLLSKEAEEVLPSPAPTPAGALLPSELQRPLLAEEAPPAPATAQRAGLQRALAIIRYIEAITELGVAPPPGVGLYGFQAMPLHYAAQHLAPPIPEGEEEDAGTPEASPGFSPFAGAAEPGSESPGLAASVAEDAAGEGGELASAVPASPSSGSLEILPTPGEGAAPGSAGAAEPSERFGSSPDSWQGVAGGNQNHSRERTQHGSYDALRSLQEQPPPRPATLPRPVSADNLGRVASLAHGIPRVRTRPGTLAAGAGGRRGQPGAGGRGMDGDETESSVEQDDFVVLRPGGWRCGRLANLAGQETGTEAGAMFAADEDLGESALRGALLQRELLTAPSATVLLGGLRGSGGRQAVGAPAVGQAGVPAEGVGSGELPVSFSPPTEPLPGGAAATTSSQPAAARVPAVAEPATAAETPAFRSAAIQRLAQIFGGVRRRGWAGLGGSGSSGGPSGGTSRAASGGIGPAGASSAAGAGPVDGWEGLSDGDGREDVEAGSVPASATLSPVGFTPVRQYIAHRQGKLEAKQRRRRQREEAAAAEGREPEPGTPPPSSYGGFARLFGFTPSLAAAAQMPAPQEQPAAQQVSTELMREALGLEMQEAVADNDPTVTMVISMLSKKLEREVKEAKRQQRLHRRKARQQAKEQAARAAAQAAAAEGAEAGGAAVAAPPAGPAAGPEAGLAAAEAKPSEAAAAVAAQAAAVEQLGFGAALKRLASDPQVVTFFALCTILGFGHGIVGGFLFMFLAEQGGSEMLMGMVLTANALPELPAFYFFGRILSAVGMYSLLFASAATLGLRIWAYSLLPHIPLGWVVPIEALHAITYAFGWSASAVNASKIAPPGLEGTTQGLFQGLWTGVGVGCAGILGGLLYDSRGAAFLFRLSGLAILGSTAAAALPILALRWRRKRRGAEPLPSRDSFESLGALGGH